MVLESSLTDWALGLDLTSTGVAQRAKTAAGLNSQARESIRTVV